MAQSNKKRLFNYKPRFQEDSNEALKRDFHNQWQELKGARSRKSSILTSPLFLVLFLIAVLLLIYVLNQYE